jgi:hypothetical protein
MREELASYESRSQANKNRAFLLLTIVTRQIIKTFPEGIINRLQKCMLQETG